MDKNELAWLERYRLVDYGREYVVSAADRAEIARRLKRLGVAARTLRRVTGS